VATEPLLHTGDVVIRRRQLDTRTSFELCSTDGEAQIRFATRTGAEAAACAFAQASRVNVWTSEQEALRLVAGFRTSARPASRPMATPLESLGAGAGRRAWPA